MGQVSKIIPLVGIGTGAALLVTDIIQTGKLDQTMFIAFMMFSVGGSALFGILKNWNVKKSNK